MFLEKICLLLVFIGSSCFAQVCDTLLLESDSWVHCESLNSENIYRNGKLTGCQKIKSNGIVSSVSYFYEDKRIAILDQKDFIFKFMHIESLENNYRLKVPIDWVNLETQALSTIQKSGISDFSPTISITNLKLEPKFNFDDHISEFVDVFLSQNGDETLIQKRRVVSEFNDINGVKLIYQFEHSQLSLTNTIFMLHHSDKNELVIFNCTALSKDFINYKCIFEEIFSSIVDDCDRQLFKKINVIF